MATTDWDSWEPGAQAYETQVRNLFRAVLGLHSTFTDEIWLGRGQSNEEYRLESAGHPRAASFLSMRRFLFGPRSRGPCN